MTMRNTILAASMLMTGASLIGVSVAMAHVDDLKERWIDETWTGPGYRGGEGKGLGDFPSQGITVLSWVTVPEFGDTQTAMNDCWGYTSPSGREYAILGLGDGTGFAEITDPYNPVVLETIAAPHVVQRDVKIFQTYAYIGGENSAHGVQIVDLSDIDNGNVTLAATMTGDGSDKTHNIVIDTDSGFLYRCGGSGNGLRIYDLNTTPTNPTPVGWWPDRYVHDAQVVTYTEGPYAGRQIAFCCGGFNNGWEQPGLDILDVTDKSNIQLLSRTLHDNNEYSHQGWLSDDQQYFYLSDELNEYYNDTPTTMHIFDVSDLTNVSEVGTATNGGTSTTHNLYTLGDLIFLANYSAGLRVFDASDPLAPTEIAHFDTHPEDDNTGFSGMWSCYPYFESGVIIGSDRSRGMFLFRLDGQTVCTSDVAGDDNLVDVNDLLLLLSGWGTDGPGADIAEPNNVIDVSDLLQMLGSWGPCQL